MNFLSDDTEQLTITDDIEQQCLEAFFCPITREIMQNPVILIADGHTYEATALYQWFQTGGRISPLTGQIIASTNTKNNYALKKAISEFLTKYPEHKKQTMDQENYQKTLLEIIKLREQDLAVSMEKNQSNQNKNKSNNMSTEVAEFLQNIDQSEYIDTFISNAIYSMDTLQLLTENDLKELIHEVGARRVIYNEIQKLKARFGKGRGRCGRGRNRGRGRRGGRNRGRDRCGKQQYDNRPRCWNCDSPGHMQYQCPHLKGDKI